MKSASQRVLVFILLILSVGFASTAFSQATRLETKGKWIAGKQTNPMDDTTSILLSLKANSPVKGWLTTETPTLFIRCHSNKTDVYFNLGMQTSVEPGNYDASTVTMRIDKNKPFKLVTNKSTDNKALFVRKPIGFIRQLMEAEELLLQFIPFNAPQVMTSFSIAGLKESIEPLRKTCKW